MRFFGAALVIALYLFVQCAEGAEMGGWNFWQNRKLLLASGNEAKNMENKLFLVTSGGKKFTGVALKDKMLAIPSSAKDFKVGDKALTVKSTASGWSFVTHDAAAAPIGESYTSGNKPSGSCNLVGFFNDKPSEMAVEIQAYTMKTIQLKEEKFCEGDLGAGLMCDGKLVGIVGPKAGGGGGSTEAGGGGPGADGGSTEAGGGAGGSDASGGAEEETTAAARRGADEAAAKTPAAAAAAAERNAAGGAGTTPGAAAADDDDDDAAAAGGEDAASGAAADASTAARRRKRDDETTAAAEGGASDAASGPGGAPVEPGGGATDDGAGGGEGGGDCAKEYSILAMKAVEDLIKAGAAAVRAALAAVAVVAAAALAAQL